MNCGSCKWFQTISTYNPAGGCLNPINDILRTDLAPFQIVRTAKMVDLRYDFCTHHAPKPAPPGKRDE